MYSLLSNPGFCYCLIYIKKHLDFPFKFISALNDKSCLRNINALTFSADSPSNVSFDLTILIITLILILHIFTLNLSNNLHLAVSLCVIHNYLRVNNEKND
jgi:hypothetical protein